MPATPDALDTVLDINGGIAKFLDGQIIILKANNGTRDVVVKDGTGNLKLAGDMTLDHVDDEIAIRWDEKQGYFTETWRSDNSI